MYQYKNLEGISFYEMSQCMNGAFSDYALPIHLDEWDLSDLFSASGIDRQLSFGAFFNGALVGFMFHSCGPYQGHQSVFDVAAGVTPAHRGKQIFTHLFALTEQALKQRQIKRYYLEVLQQNEHAISLYKRHGFSISRNFVVLVGHAQIESKQSQRVQYSTLAVFDFQQTTDLYRDTPSYEHSDHILALHPERYKVAYIKEETLSAWCVFSKLTGQFFSLDGKTCRT